MLKKKIMAYVHQLLDQPSQWQTSQQAGPGSVPKFTSTSITVKQLLIKNKNINQSKSSLLIWHYVLYLFLYMFAMLACATTIQKFKRLYLLYFWIKISSMGMRFLSLNKRNNLLSKLFDFAEMFRFSRLPLIFHVQIKEKPILNKKSYNVLKRDNGRYCWMGIRRMK